MFNTLFHAQYAGTGNLAYRDFYLKFYSWVTPPNLNTLNPLTEEYVCFSDDAQLPGTYDLNAAYDDNRLQILGLNISSILKSSGHLNLITVLLYKCR